MPKKKDLRTPKGTRDLMADDLVYWDKITSKAKEVAGYYGFVPIRTPHFERTEVFTASLGETSDIVEKQMYTFKPRGSDSITLRPEGTAPIMRSYLQHGMHTLPQPVMLYYEGSFFRHEQPQRGRFREFGQFGVEILGDASAVSDAIVIRVMTLILKELNIGNFELHINSIGDKDCFPTYRKEVVAYYRKKVNYICKDCRVRLKTNPLRLLDCSHPDCIEIRTGAPQTMDYLCDNCKNHFKEVLDFLDEMGVSYFLGVHLVRGLDYYSRTVFEAFPEHKEPRSSGTDKEDKKRSSKGANKEEGPQSPIAIMAGGRYDYLAQYLSKKAVPAVGAAMGIDRLADMLMKKNPRLSKQKLPLGFLIQLGPQAKRKSLLLMEELRKAKIPIKQSLSRNSLKSQLAIADKIGVPYALIIGQKEAVDGTVMVRNMDSGAQEVVSNPKIINYLKKKASRK